MIQALRMVHVNLLLFGAALLSPTSAWQSSNEVTRRRGFLDQVASRTLLVNALVTGLPTTAKAAATEGRILPSKGSFSQRLDNDILQQPTPTFVSNELYGVDNFFYPDFMAGTWNVTQTLVKATTPLGLIYLGGPNGVQSIAEKTMAETQSQLNVPVELQLRYVPTKWGVAEDRVFNTRQRLNSFAGRSVVATVDYADVGSSNRAKVLAMGGKADDPLQTTFVRFKGPAAQKTFLTAHGAETTTTTTAATETTTWTGFEAQRSIFALTNENTAPPIFTDTELIWQFTPIAAAAVGAGPETARVQGRLRIASYLNANQDKLYFEARNRAVSLLDYQLDMRRP